LPCYVYKVWICFANFNWFVLKSYQSQTELGPPEENNCCKEAEDAENSITEQLVVEGMHNDSWENRLFIRIEYDNDK